MDGLIYRVSINKWLQCVIVDCGWFWWEINLLTGDSGAALLTGFSTLPYKKKLKKKTKKSKIGAGFFSDLQSC